MKKRITLLIVCVLLAVTACGNSTERQIAKQLELGKKYLSELNYEEAIVAFQKVIDLEPKNVEAYLQLAEIHVHMEDYGSAIEILECGYAVTQEETIQKKLKEINEIFQSIQEWEKLNEESKGLLKPVYDFLSADNIDGAIKLIRNEEYYDLAEQLTEGHLLYEEGDEKCLGVYPKVFSGGTRESCFYYFGTYDEGLRSGQGLWIQVLEHPDSVRNITGWYRVFSGEWRDDYPNGYGEDKARLLVDSVEQITITKGNYTNGFADGDMIEANNYFHFREEDGWRYLHYHADLGTPVIVDRTVDGDGTTIWLSDDYGYRDYGEEPVNWGITGARKGIDW